MILLSVGVGILVSQRRGSEAIFVKFFLCDPASEQEEGRGKGESKQFFFSLPLVRDPGDVDKTRSTVISTGEPVHKLGY